MTKAERDHQLHPHYSGRRYSTACPARCTSGKPKFSSALDRASHKAVETAGLLSDYSECCAVTLQLRSKLDTAQLLMSLSSSKEAGVFALGSHRTRMSGDPRASSRHLVRAFLEGIVVGLLEYAEGVIHVRVAVLVGAHLWRRSPQQGHLATASKTASCPLLCIGRIDGFFCIIIQPQVSSRRGIASSKICSLKRLRSLHIDDVALKECTGRVLRL